MSNIVSTMDNLEGNLFQPLYNIRLIPLWDGSYKVGIGDVQSVWDALKDYRIDTCHISLEMHLFDYEGHRIMACGTYIQLGNDSTFKGEWIIEVLVASNYLEAIWEEYDQYRKDRENDQAIHHD